MMPCGKPKTVKFAEITVISFHVAMKYMNYKVKITNVVVILLQ